jgi:hypothetical protein
VAIFEFDSEHGVGQGLDDGAFEHDRIFLGLGQFVLLLKTVLLPRRIVSARKVCYDRTARTPCQLACAIGYPRLGE